MRVSRITRRRKAPPRGVFRTEQTSTRLSGSIILSMPLLAVAIVVAAVALYAIAAGARAAGPRGPTKLGSMSDQWIAEHRASHES
jgi:hypothetical protein